MTRFVTFILLFLLSAPAFAQKRHRKKVNSHTKIHKTHHKKKYKKQRVKTVRRTHHHANRSAVHVHVGRTYHYGYGHQYHHTNHYRTHSVYHHVHSPHCPSSHHVQYRIVYEKAFEPPALSCPSRTDEVRNGLTQWCETTRGTRHGPYREWRDDGTLSVAGEYLYDSTHDVWLSYHKNGVIQRESSYMEGERIGSWYTWDTDGAIISVTTY